MNFRGFNYEGKFSQFLLRIFELIIINWIFMLTCIPIFTIGAAITALTTVSLRMHQDRCTYVVKDYFKAFKQNFKHATGYWFLFLIVMFLLYFIHAAAATNGIESLTKAYTVIIFVFGLLYTYYFMVVFALLANFENTFKGTLQNGLNMIIAHFPMLLTAFLTIAVPAFISLGINNQVFIYSSLFWILIGFSLLSFWCTYYINKVFVKYMPKDEEYTDAFEAQAKVGGQGPVINSQLPDKNQE